MMDNAEAVGIIRSQQKFLKKVVGQFKPEHAGFRPVPDMMSVVEQFRHAGLTVKWFVDGVFGEGFDMDFERMMREVREPRTLAEAMAELDATCDAAVAVVEKAAPGALNEPMPDNPIFGKAPRSVAFGALCDHTAHHRGALSVYLRLCGVTPVMIYGD